MFPQVITNVIDNSLVTPSTSRFSAGLVGIAQRGAFNTAARTPDVPSFVRLFGQPIAGSFLGDAVALISNTSDGSRVVRVGAQYNDLAISNASGTSGSYSVNTVNANMFAAGQYVRIRQVGKATTPNAPIASVSGNTITLVSVGASAVPLADSYNGATVSSALVANAASEAETFLTSPTYGSAVSGLGTVVGDKNSYQVSVSGSTAGLSVGDVLKLTQTGKVTTSEIKVTSIRGDGVVFFVQSPMTDIGYQSLPLQDSYNGATVYKVTAQAGTSAVQIFANSAGTWANTAGNTFGLTLRVSPGSAAGSKKFLVYQGSTLVETIDNLNNTVSDPNYYTTAINGRSSYITVFAVLGTEPPGNTYNPWNLVTGTPSNNATFAGGFNGENVTDADYIGTVNPTNDTPTGLKIFDSGNASPDVDVSFICVPDSTSIAVYQECARIAARVNSIGIGSIPDNLNAREAIDWHNGAGLYTSNGKIDNYRFALFWNWFQISDTFTGANIYVPPALGYLRAAAAVFDNSKPWMAVAGDTRGVIPEAEATRFNYVALSTKNAMYGNGNSVNAILPINNSIEIYGDRTLQRAETKLTAIHNVVLVNYILKNFSVIARRYTFDPIDTILLEQLSLDYNNFMATVKTERGVDDFLIVLDSTNNTAATKNNKQVVVNLSIIPIDVAEVFIITANVESTGTTLTGISSTPIS